MKTAAITLLLLTTGVTPLLAVNLLSVDFGREDTLAAGVTSTTGGTPLEPGFQGFYASGAAVYSGELSRTYTGLNNTFTTGSATVSVLGAAAAGSIGGRDRGTPLDSGAFTYGDLLRDGIARTNLTSVGGQYTFKIGGLLPVTTYEIQLWGANSTADAGTIYSWYNTTGGSSLMGTITNGPNNPLTAVSNNDYSVLANVTSSATGELLFGVTSSNGSATAGFINGFVLNSAPIPEPSALLMGALGAGWILSRRRASTRAGL